MTPAVLVHCHSVSTELATGCGRTSMMARNEAAKASVRIVAASTISLRVQWVQIIAIAPVPAWSEHRIEPRRPRVNGITILLNFAVPAFRLVNTSIDGRYRISKTVFSDPVREVVLQVARLRFTMFWPKRNAWQGCDFAIEIAA